MRSIVSPGILQPDSSNLDKNGRGGSDPKKESQKYFPIIPLISCPKEQTETIMRIQEMERNWLGRELHDNVNQILSTARLFIETVEPVDEKQQQAKIKSVECILLAIEEIRKLSKEMVTPQLEEMGLAENIQALIDDIQIAAPIRFLFTYDPGLKFLSPGKKITLFRIVQEQVKNILNHSDAKTAGISFTIHEQHVLLKIWDNGKGFVPGRTNGGIGLSNIRERVLFYNGRMDLHAGDGTGCRITIVMPIG